MLLTSIDRIEVELAQRFEIDDVAVNAIFSIMHA